MFNRSPLVTYCLRHCLPSHIGCLATVRIRRIRGHVFVWLIKLWRCLLFSVQTVMCLCSSEPCTFLKSCHHSSVISGSSMVSSSALIHVSFAVSRLYLIYIIIIPHRLCKAKETLSLTNTLFILLTIQLTCTLDCSVCKYHDTTNSIYYICFLAVLSFRISAGVYLITNYLVTISDCSITVLISALYPLNTP